ncbi:hypothetical protein QL285_045870 [Trifolium repens]|nr:hypothetical protein QL285_045870 [Trifolium repens]
MVSTTISLSKSSVSKSPTIKAATSEAVGRLYRLPSRALFPKILSFTLGVSCECSVSRTVLYVRTYGLLQLSSASLISLTILDLIA